MEFRYQFGFIGAGNMGFAIMKGLLKTFSPENITFYEKDPERAGDVAASTAVVAADSALACASSSQYVILAVKPQQLGKVAEAIGRRITKEQILISIAPGVSVADLKGFFGEDTRVVRAMPNTPALVGEGSAASAMTRLLSPRRSRPRSATFLNPLGGWCWWRRS